jgi:3-oxoacyl-[acyl-carrier protein] reductase
MLSTTLSPSSQVQSRLALITGAARGLGRGIAETLAEQGFLIAIADITTEKDASEVIQALKSRDRFAGYHQIDVSDELAVRRLFADLDAEGLAVDVLVNNAGTSRPQTIREITLNDWNDLLRINLTSAFLCSKEAFSRMEQRRSGCIVNISSVAAERGALLGHAHYSASKAGLLGLTRTLARTGAPVGIRVNAVAPGIIDTELLRRVHSDEEIDRIAATVPLGIGQPRDVGLAVAFLCGEGGRYITGSVLDVNGGAHIH